MTRDAPPSRYPPLGVAVDTVLFSVADARLQVLLTLRERAPFEGRWSLPGGFVGPHERADEAALRELSAKAGVTDLFLEQLYTFSDPDRDPRSRVVSVAHYALVSPDKGADAGGSRRARWFEVGTDARGELWVGRAESARPLAFDHDRILDTALRRIRGKLDYAPIGYQLLPERFTLTELQQVYEAVLGEAVDKRNFRAKIRRAGEIRALDAFRTGSHRPARLYTFVGRVF
jgi:8-oxo-dGTP diphosphatase